MTEDVRTDNAARVLKTFPSFEPQTPKGGRWFVAVTTGVGPISHIWDFATEVEAEHLEVDKVEILARQTDLSTR